MPGNSPETKQTIMKTSLSYLTRLLLLLALFCGSSARAADKKIVLIAGKPSHGKGEHEFRAGCLLLKKCLDQVSGVSSAVYMNGWPTKIVNGKTMDDNSVFEGANSIFIYCDGGDGHPAIRPERLQVLALLMKKGV